MRIFFMRHGAAVPEETGINDEERPLSEEGALRINGSTKGLEKLTGGIDKVFTSPYKRAVETAKIVSRKLSIENRVELIEDLKPAGSNQKIIKLLLSSGKEETVLVIGHEPKLSFIISSILKIKRKTTKLKKGGIAVVDCAGGKCIIDCILYPSHLKTISRR